MSLAHKEVQSPILFQVKNFEYFFLSLPFEQVESTQLIS